MELVLSEDNQWMGDLSFLIYGESLHVMYTPMHGKTRRLNVVENAMEVAGMPGLFSETTGTSGITWKVEDGA